MLRALLLGIALLGLDVAAAHAADAVGYVERVYAANDPAAATARLSNVMVVERDGRPLSLAGRSVGLQPRDRVFVTDPDKVVAIRMVATGKLVVVRPHRGASREPDWVVASAIPGLPGAAFEAFVSWIRGADQSGPAIGALSRAAPAAASCATPTGRMALDLSGALDGPARLAAGEQQLWVGWKGGVAPFRVALYDQASGALLSDASAARTACWARLPTATILPGRLYRLEVTDADGAREAASGLAGAALPPMPAELRRTGLDDPTRDLYFATWLTLQESGAWTFSAVQRVAALPCSPAVAEWLEAHAAGGCGAGERTPP